MQGGAVSQQRADGPVVRHLTGDDVEEAARVFRRSLAAKPPTAADVERYQGYWDVQHSLCAVDRHGRVLGVAATFAAEFTVEGGAALPCAAVPSVGVRPDRHGTGVGRALLEQQVREAHDRGAALLALNSSEVPIYGRYGYGPTSRWWSTKTDPRLLAWREDAPAVTPGSVEELEDGDEAVARLSDLHDRVLGRWAGELSRPANWWHGASNPPADAAPRIHAVHRDADGRVDAAITFTAELRFDDAGFANAAEVRDSVALSPAHEALLWRWVLERRLLGAVTAERTNPRLALPWMLVDPRQLRTTAEGDAVWVRILDVPRVLGARTTTAAGRVVVRVVDPLVAANDGCWELVGDGGRLEVRATDAEPEVTLPVGLFASAAWGYARTRTLAAAGRISGASDAAMRRLDALLATDGPAWCSTGF